MKILRSCFVLSISLFTFCSCKTLLINHAVNKFNKKNGLEVPQMALEDLSGKIVHLSDFDDNTVLLNSWGTWCKPCINEMPGINMIAAKLKENPKIIVLNIGVGSKKEEWKKVVEREKLSGVNLFLPDSLYKKYMDVLHVDEEGLPYNIILGKGRKVLGGGMGVDLGSEGTIATYMLLQAEKGIDATASLKQFIKLYNDAGKNKSGVEVENFKLFLEKYVQKI
jgi:thiol-disulfide isomerase/thioredoxin